MHEHPDDPAAARSRRVARMILFGIFALSGVAGLIYEAVWSRYIKLLVGHSAYAQTYVIAVFMGGMAIGAYLSGRYSVRIKSLLKGYAYIEFGIGLFAVAFQGLFEFSMSLTHDTILPSLDSMWAVTLVKQLVSIGLVLPACVLLGMTFPLMTGGVVRLFPQTSGSGIANLYFTNSIGAAAGVLLTGFLFVDAFGLPGTMLLAAALNFFIGVAVLLIANRMPEPPLAMPMPERGDGPTNPRLLLGVAAVTGLASFVYEIAWIRMLSMLLGSSSHAFELMLATFIAGLAFGGLWIKRRIDRLEDPTRYLAGVQWVMGILAVITVFVYGPCFDLMAGIMDGVARTDSGYVLFNIMSYGIAVLVMFPAAFCAGTTLPLITVALLRKGYGEKSIGNVYSANTLGAIAGVVLATHVGLPLLGLKGLVCFGAGVDIVAGLVLFLSVGSKRVAYIGGAGATALLLFALFAVRFDTAMMASGVFRYGLADDYAVDVRFHQDGKAASVTVFDTRQGVRSVVTNGKPAASVHLTGEKSAQDEVVQDLTALLPLALHPQAKRIALVGFGSGMTTARLLLSPTVERVDTIEIEAAMLAAGEFFRPHNDLAYEDPRSNLVVDDARSYLAATREPYDVVISEPSNPWVSGVSSLFTREWYAHVAKQLADDGLLVQWLQLYELDVTLAASILEALGEHFEHYTLFAISPADIVIVARQDAPVGPLSPDIFAVPIARERLARYGVTDVEYFEALRLGSRAALAPYWRSHGVPPNSDYFPFLDNRAAHARFVRASADDVIQAGGYPLPLYDLLGGDKPTSQSRPDRAGRHGLLPPMQVQAAQDAQLVARWFMGQPLPADAALAAGLSRPLTAYKATLTDCAPVSEARLNQAFFVLAKATVPLLPVDVSTALMNAVKGSPCHAGRPAGYQRWVDFFAAAGARDTAALDQAAGALVAAGAITADWSGQVLLAGAMIAAIRQGDPARARALFKRHAKTVIDGEIPFVFHLIGAHAGPN